MKAQYISLALALLTSHRTEASPHKLLASQEEQLVRAAIPSKLKQLPAFQIEFYRDPSSSRYDFIEAIWAGTPDGSVIVGHYAVDSTTGDVFDAVSSCNELSTSSLRRLQMRVRTQLHLSKSHYKKIKSKGPLCEE